jgi:uncharacterized protein
VCARQDFLEAAAKAADFLLTYCRPNGSLIRSYREGAGTVSAFLEDYAFLTGALLTLYEAGFDERYYLEARNLADEMISHFGGADGGFFDAPASDDLVVRPRGFFDNPIPSGNSAAAHALLRLAGFTGEMRYVDAVLPGFKTVRDLLPRAPLAFPHMLAALDWYLSPVVQIAVAGNVSDERTIRLANIPYERPLPARVLAVGVSDRVPLLAGRGPLQGEPAAYVCEHFACRLPVTDPSQLREQLVSLTPRGQPDS